MRRHGPGGRLGGARRWRQRGWPRCRRDHARPVDLPGQLGVHPRAAGHRRSRSPGVAPRRPQDHGPLRRRERGGARLSRRRHLGRRRGAPRPGDVRVRHGRPVRTRPAPAGVRLGAHRGADQRRRGGGHPDIARRRGADDLERWDPARAVPRRGGVHHAHLRAQRHVARGSTDLGDERPQRCLQRPRRPGRVRHADDPADGRSRTLRCSATTHPTGTTTTPPWCW